MQLLSGVHHFGISVASLAETVAWYQTKLGFEPDYSYEFSAGMKVKAAFLKLGSLRVEIFEADGASPMPANRADFSGDLREHGTKHVALLVADINAARRELESRGVEFVTPTGEVPSSGGAHYAFFRDNNGILIELYQPAN